MRYQQVKIALLWILVIRKLQVDIPDSFIIDIMNTIYKIISLKNKTP